MIVYHIVLPESWDRQKNNGNYEHESLATEKFIHCSYDTQLDAVIGRYYTGVERVLILSIDTDKLTSELIEEPSTGGEIYPHIYGKINRDAIVDVSERTDIG
jgi:uncharacterized protein (DUF952 family)